MVRHTPGPWGLPLPASPRSACLSQRADGWRAALRGPCHTPGAKAPSPQSPAAPAEWMEGQRKGQRANTPCMGGARAAEQQQSERVLGPAWAAGPAPRFPGDGETGCKSQKQASLRRRGGRRPLASSSPAPAAQLSPLAPDARRPHPSPHRLPPAAQPCSGSLLPRRPLSPAQAVGAAEALRGQVASECPSWAERRCGGGHRIHRPPGGPGLHPLLQDREGGRSSGLSALPG